MIKVLVADDYELARWSTQQYLNQTQIIDCIGCVETGFEAIEFCKKTKVDVVLMDVVMPVLNGIETTKRLMSEHKGLKILAYTAHHSIDNISELLKAGVRGYMLKKNDPNELAEAIVKVYKGGHYFCDTVMTDIVKLIKNRSTNDPTAESKAFKDLTRQERRVLDFIAMYMSNKEIASKLNVSPRTIETHKRNLVIKFSLQNPKELVNVATRLLRSN